MSKRMIMSFIGEGVSVEVELLEEEAPKTCKLIWDNLPLKGKAIHLSCSGNAVSLGLPGSIRLDEMENASSRLMPGEMGYYFTKGKKWMYWPNDEGEITWYYGRIGSMHQPDGPCPINIFGRMLGDTSQMFEVSHRTQLEGMKTVEFRRAE